MTRGITTFWGGAQIEASILSSLAAGTGLLLLVGLWTPTAGAMVASLELWYALSQPADSWTPILLGTLGAALAMIGHGAWSVDARYSGGNVSTSQLEGGSFHPPLELYSPDKESLFKKTQYSRHTARFGVLRRRNTFHNPRQEREDLNANCNRSSHTNCASVRERREERQRSPYVSDK
jgi:hypothetical protein